MPKGTLDPSTLISFGNAAAGHDGVLSDPSGQLVIKPCTPVEVAFYESVVASHPELATFLPTFYGTLALNDPAKAAEVIAAAESTTEPPKVPTQEGTAASLAISDHGPMHGKKLTTDVSIVLENTTAGFKKPNVLDIKLGAVLYEDDARPEKKARLDKVAGETTTGSLGFRIAGMRVWQGEEAMKPQKDDGLVETEDATTYKVYNKMYGRKFSAEDVERGFEEFLLVPGAGIDSARALAIVKQFRKDVEDIIAIFEAQESRMFSASILFVYEGDPAAYDQAARAIGEIMAKRLAAEENDAAEEEDDDDEDIEIPKLVSTKLIDFAHASWTPGKGPDENSLQGMRNTAKILAKLEQKYETPL